MDWVVHISKDLLKHNLYYDNDSDDESDNESEDGNKSDNDSDSSLGDSDDEMSSDHSDGEESNKLTYKCEVKSSKKSAMKKNSKSMTREPEPKAPEAKSEPHKSELDPAFKSNMDDLADRISKLTIELTQHQEKPKFNPQVSTSAMWKCFMCESEGHSVRECPETKAFVAAGVLQYDIKNHLVMADGS